MVNLKNKKLDLIFHALADSTRRDILHRLGSEEQGISDLAEHYSMTLAAVSKHVKVLERAALVHTEKRGRTHVCTANSGAIETASLVLRHYQKFWEDQLDTLENYFAATAEKERKDKQ
jgi:DNA-binding transcriptional ArsR family regulator